MSETMGRNEYARHRGVAPNAVTKAVTDGRIAAAVTMEDGRIKGIDWRLADQLWVRNTDPEQAAKNEKNLGTPPGGEIHPERESRAQPVGESEPSAVQGSHAAVNTGTAGTVAPGAADAGDDE